MISPKLKDTQKIIDYVKFKFNINLSEYKQDDIINYYKKLIYLFNKNIFVNNINDTILLHDKSKKKYSIEGQQKRIGKLVDKGYYDKIILSKNKLTVCHFCKKEYKIGVNQSNKNGYCCLKCYKESGGLFLNLQKTYLINKGIDINNLTIQDIKTIYSNEKIKETTISNKKRIKTINKKYKGGFSSIVISGFKNKKINFLLKNNIIEKNNTYSDDYIDYQYKKYFNIINKHSDKIKKGIIEKNGHNYKEILYQNILNYYKKWLIDNMVNVEIDNLSPPDLIKEFYKYFINNKSIKRWKLSNILNNTNIINNLKNSNFEDLNVDVLYSEYLSNRIKNLVDNTHNGYKRTKKGWYIYKNIDNEMFYRSSWELYIYKILDELLSEKQIKYVDIPDRVEYFYDFKRHYFPDIVIKYNDDDFRIIEIKPKNKLILEMNINKFKRAVEKYNYKFIILTEDDIFDIEIKNKIKNKFDKNGN